MTRLEHWLDYLFDRINYERTNPSIGSFKLERMTELLRRLGNPQQQYPIVHIAGSKGKGSTAFMVGSILHASNRNCGLYTSPHLHGLEERIRLNGVSCSAGQLADLIEGIQPLVSDMDRDSQWDRGPTFFEITTAMAFQYFAKQNVDVAVVEVGLGGRLDSTNVCQPVVSVITSISLDHTQLLGDSIEEIAAEKAGIIKPGIPVICGVSPDHAAFPVIAQRAAEASAAAYFWQRDFECEYRSPTLFLDDQEGVPTSSLDFRWLAGTGLQRNKLELPLLGAHQATNASVALATVTKLSELGWSDIGDEHVRRGLARVNCAARIEVVGHSPLVIVDAAHNVASVEALRDVLRSQLRTQDRWLVFGTSQDKDMAGMLTVLLPEFEEVILTRYLSNPRSAQPDELLRVAESLEIPLPKISLCDNPRTACQQLIDRSSGGETICIAGSFYLVAEVRESLVEQSESFAF